MQCVLRARCERAVHNQSRKKRAPAAALAAAEYRATQSAKDAVTMSALPEGLNTQSSVFSESTVEVHARGDSAFC